jgi:hypothetical protein
MEVNFQYFFHEEVWIFVGMTQCRKYVADE